MDLLIKRGVFLGIWVLSSYYWNKLIIMDGKCFYLKAEICGELEEDAGVEGSDPGPAEAGGHSEEAR